MNSSLKRFLKGFLLGATISIFWVVVCLTVFVYRVCGPAMCCVGH